MKDSGRNVARSFAGGCSSSPFLTSAATLAASAQGSGCRPTVAAGACSQRPMHGAGSTRTPGPSSAGSFSSSARAPAISHAIESHTRTVTAGGAASPSITTSK